MAVKYPDILESNNPQEYGIVPAKQVAGHKTVNTLNDLYSIADAILSVSKVNTNNDAIGQLWYVISERKYYQLIDWDNRNNGNGWEENNTTNLQKITYTELVNLAGSNKLIPGCSYRITDYKCTTSQPNTQAVDNKFDIIVFAINSNQLNENALAVHHEGDTYFQNCNLNTWKLKYCLYNDVDRFPWATLEGKGVIYQMIDDKNNNCPYDFKNIQIHHEGMYVYTFSNIIDDVVFDGTVSLTNSFYNNTITTALNKEISNNVFILTSKYYSCNQNTIIDSNECVLKNDCNRNVLNHCSNISLGTSCSDNTVNTGCEFINIQEFCSQNIFYPDVTNCTLGTGVQNCVFYTGANVTNLSYTHIAKNSKGRTVKFNLADLYGEDLFQAEVQTGSLNITGDT